LANGVATIIGGCIYDHIAIEKSTATTFYMQIFALGFIGRMLAVPLLTRLIEPGARRVRDVL